jgi:hypothetical protein
VLSAKRKSLSKIIFVLLITLPQLAFAIPVDWQGVFGADYNALSNYTLLKEEPASGSKTDASFPSYLIKLLPVFTINDTASFKSEFSTGYARGGFFGNGQTFNYKNDQFGDVLYYYNTFNALGQNSAGNNTILFNRFWMELYSDTATYGIGRQSFDWGMGAIYSGGNKTWDRFASIRDMAVAKIKLGNFGLEPFFGKIGQGNTLTSETYAIEFGVPITYDIPESDMKMGFLWTKKNIAAQNDVLDTPTSSTNTSFLSSSGINVFDLYFKKTFGKLGMELEAPFFSGDLGNFRGNTGNTKYSAVAVLLNLEYKFSYPFKMGFDFGMVPGDNTADDTFKAMYLNPNYHIASILFRYNQQAITNNTDYNVWDIYVVNTNYLKLYFEYTTEKWLLNFATLYAQANQAAKKDGEYIVYEQNTYPEPAIGDQSKDLGLEFDFTFDYAWNNEVKLGGEVGYLMTGDYFKFNNTTTPNQTANPFLLKLKAAVTF